MVACVCDSLSSPGGAYAPAKDMFAWMFCVRTILYMFTLQRFPGSEVDIEGGKQREADSTRMRGTAGYKFRSKQGIVEVGCEKVLQLRELLILGSAIDCDSAHLAIFS